LEHLLNNYKNKWITQFGGLKKKGKKKQQ